MTFDDILDILAYHADGDSFNWASWRRDVIEGGLTESQVERIEDLNHAPHLDCGCLRYQTSWEREVNQILGNT